MSQFAMDKARLLAPDNTALPRASASGLSLGLIGFGAILLIVTLIAGITGDAVAAQTAMAAYHVGFLVITGIALGGLVFTMILHQVNAGWAALVRRQVENLMSMLPVCALLFLPTLALIFLSPGLLWGWMDPANVAGDLLYQEKSAYLNTGFFIGRAVVYLLIWTWLSTSLYRASREQDHTGDKWLTAKARRRSSYGLLLFALTTAFAAFDWEMTLDHHWFSTMLGVYFFASNMVAGLAVVMLVLLALRATGRLQGLVTEEHFHDLGKLTFGFVVFWAYIGFSQYFLIWYGNIPEETAYFTLRHEHGWENVSMALAVGRFVVPFVVLMARPARRSPLILSLMGVWLVFFHIVDVYWLVRPTIEDATSVVGWLDVVGVLGPICVFSGLLIRRIASAPLVPVNDPRMEESITHWNTI